MCLAHTCRSSRGCSLESRTLSLGALKPVLLLLVFFPSSNVSAAGNKILVTVTGISWKDLLNLRGHGVAILWNGTSPALCKCVPSAARNPPASQSWGDFSAVQFTWDPGVAWVLLVVRCKGKLVTLGCHQVMERGIRCVRYLPL